MKTKPYNEEFDEEFGEKNKNKYFYDGVIDTIEAPIYHLKSFHQKRKEMLKERIEKEKLNIHTGCEDKSDLCNECKMVYQILKIIDEVM